jgi:hypothetical protein
MLFSAQTSKFLHNYFKFIKKYQIFKPFKINFLNHLTQATVKQTCKTKTLGYLCTYKRCYLCPYMLTKKQLFSIYAVFELTIFSKKNESSKAIF